MSTYRKWLNSYPAVCKWASKYDLEKSLDDGGGIAFFKDFLPTHVAEGILQDLEKIKDWNATAADRDYAHNNVRHAFWSVRQAPVLETITRAITQVLPDSLHSFSAAKYTKDHHIVKHDDRAYTDVMMEDGAIVQCSRNIALIIYFTRDWKEEYGGLLIDNEAPGGPLTFVPQFNTAVTFRIPRWHTVTPMKVERPRYTLFGWFLEPGHLYDLDLVDTGEGEEDEAGLVGLSELKAAGIPLEPKGAAHGKHARHGSRKRGRAAQVGEQGHGAQGAVWARRLRGTLVTAPRSGSGKRRVLQMLSFRKLVEQQRYAV